MKKLKEAKSAGFEVFPTQLGFFPYLWLIYMSLPVINMLREEGWKMGIGFALIGLFLVTYRQLYFAAGTPRFFVWLGIQMSIIFILCMWYHPTYMYMGFLRPISSAGIPTGANSRYPLCCLASSRRFL